MKNIFLLNEMITPKIITFVYWVLLFAVLMTGISVLFEGKISGILAIVGGAIIARIWCELLIVLFKIHENLSEIAKNKSTNRIEDV